MTENTPRNITTSPEALQEFIQWQSDKANNLSNMSAQNSSCGSRNTRNRSVRKRSTKKIWLSMEDEKLSLIVSIMAYRGLRVGAFKSLSVRGENFKTVSKGKEYKGT